MRPNSVANNRYSNYLLAERSYIPHHRSETIHDTFYNINGEMGFEFKNYRKSWAATK